MSISILCNWSMGEDERKAKISARNTKYRLANKDKIAARKSQRDKEIRAKKREIKAAYKIANRDQIEAKKKESQRLSVRLYRATAKGRDNAKARLQKWRRANPERAKSLAAAWYATARATKNFFQLTAAAAVLGTIQGSKTMKTTK
jgi:hypothetical protein